MFALYIKIARAYLLFRVIPEKMRNEYEYLSHMLEYSDHIIFTVKRAHRAWTAWKLYDAPLAEDGIFTTRGMTKFARQYYKDNALNCSVNPKFNNWMMGVRKELTNIIEDNVYNIKR